MRWRFTALIAFALSCFALTALGFAQGVPLTRADAESVLAALPQGLTISFDGFEETPTGAVLTGVKITGTAAQGTVARIAIEGADKDAIGRVFNPARYGAAAEQDFRTLAASITVEGLNLTAGPMAKLDIQKLRIEGWRMKQFELKPGDATLLKPDPLTQMFQVSGAIGDALEVDLIALENVTADVNLPSMAGNPSQSVVYRIAALNQKGISRGRSGETAVSGISLDQKIAGAAGMPDFAITTRIQDMRAEGYDFSRLVPWMIKGELPPETERDLITFGASSYSAGNADIKGVGTFEFSGLSIPAMEFVWLIPKSLDYEMQGVFRAAPELLANPMAAGLLAAEQNVWFVFGWTYDENAGTAEITRYGFGMGGWGKLVFGGKMSGLKLGTLMQLPQTFATQIAFDNAYMRWEDDGGLDKFFLLGSQTQQASGAPPASVEDTKRLAIEQAKSIAAAPPLNAPETKALIDAVVQFMTAPGTLEARLQPPQPMPLGNLMAAPGAAADPVGFVKSFGVTLVYTPK